MFGVSDVDPFPPPLRNMIQLLKQKIPTVPVSMDTPKNYPNTFITVGLVGGGEGAQGTQNAPSFVFNCYALDAGGAEDLAELLRAVLKSAQFTRLGHVQFRAFTLEGGPYENSNPDVPGRRRWQFSGTYTMN